jgi:hypothetical protein
MNPEDPDVARAARDHLIAMLIILPGRLGAGWPAEGSNWPDEPAWRAAENLAVTLCIGARELTFVHSLEPGRSAMLVVESRCGMVPLASKAHCYRKLLAMNHRNIAARPSAYALDASTKTVIYSTAYLLDSLDIDMLTEVVVDAARRAMSWQEQFALPFDPPSAVGDSSLFIQI